MRHFLKEFAASCLNGLGIIDWFEKRQKAIHILMFHQVNPNENALGLSIRPELFEEIIIFLKNRYEIISLDQLLGSLSENNNPAGCVLTFDDGYRDNYEYAFPILKKHNVPATIFVTLEALDTGVFGWDLFDQAIIKTCSGSLDLQPVGLGKFLLAGQDRNLLISDLHRMLKTLPDRNKRQIINYVVDRYGDKACHNRTMLTWSEAREMADSGLVTIGAHTVTHPILSCIDSEQAQHEIIIGKACIEKRLGLPVHYFAYPNGSKMDFNDDHVAMVKRAGYLAACSTIAGSNNISADVFVLKRIDVTSRMCTDSLGKLSPSLLLAKLSGLFVRSES